MPEVFSEHDDVVFKRAPLTEVISRVGFEPYTDFGDFRDRFNESMRFRSGTAQRVYGDTGWPQLERLVTEDDPE